MDAFRKHATKFRDQVAKQQQAVLKQFSSGGYGASQGNDTIVTDEVELQRHRQLEKLYISTKAGKQYQRDIVRGVESFIALGSRQSEFVTKISEECRKYASESPASGGTLAKACLHYGNARTQAEKERESLHKALCAQVAEPLKAMVNGAPLEDARLLAQRYDRLRQEAEAQAVELERRHVRSKEAANNADNAFKLQTAELRLQELSSSMAVLGKEAITAMSAVESQQQRLTLNRLIALVEAERTFHQHAGQILDQIEALMVSERQRSDASAPMQPKVFIVNKSVCDGIKLKEENMHMPRSVGFSQTGRTNLIVNMFLAEAIHPFEAEGEGELSLEIGDFVVVRQVSAMGWSEGECKGKAGWFPSAYVVQRRQVHADKLTEVF
eukprot:c25507_g1_i2 orf=382-1530(+)